MPGWKIPLFEPDITEDDMNAVCEPIRERWLTMGGRTKRYEDTFAEKLNIDHAIAVCSGTAALHLSLMALGITSGDEVMTPSLTFVACANVIGAVGASPVFVDICDENDWTVSPADFEAKITEKTKAIVVVHYAGFSCRMEEISRIAKKHNIAIIEDCAHALFTSRDDKKCGCFGDLACFSFFSNKNMTTGEGGMIVTRNVELAERVRLLRSHGMTSLTLDRFKGRALSYDVQAIGLNYRPNEITSALGLSQLQRLDRNLELRRNIYMQYVRTLQNQDGLSIPFQNRGSETVGYHIFPMLLNHNINREAFIGGMKEKGIQTSIHYPAIHNFTAYRELLGDYDVRCPLTETVSDREVTLPFYPSMTEEQTSEICEAVAYSIRQAT
jgi:dTDP-4-amino-4,6-dideoxygalactose transaminase